MDTESQNTTEALSQDVSTTQTEAVETTAVETLETQPKHSALDALKDKARGLSDETPTKAKQAKAKGFESAKTPPGQVQAEASTQTPAWSPDFKYKANGEEKELDERVRSVIKDKETEEWIKKVFAKADGIESIQSQREHYRNQYNTLQEEAGKVLDAVDKGDYRGALQSLGVNTQDIGQVMTGLGFRKEDVIKYAYGLAQLTPEQEMAQARQRELEQYNREQTSTTEKLNQKLYQADVQLKTFELKSVLSSPEVTPLVDAFDRQHGKGAFWDQVCQRGEYYNLKQVDKSTQELVEEVMRFARASQPMQQQPTATQQYAPQATPATHVQQKVPVIPNVMSGGGSPAKMKTTSLKGLKQFAASLED
jgi:hypothetical protein